MLINIKKIIKLKILHNNSLYRKALKYKVAAAIEHQKLLEHFDYKTVVDIGANKGQFSLVSRYCFPDAKIISFEPLTEPAGIFFNLFRNDKNTILHSVAIGPKKEKKNIHISKSNDSSSLLPISALQEKIFPGTKEIGTTAIEVVPLDTLLFKEDIEKKALLKLDVQGYELEALMGCESILSSFDNIYCECSFLELYTGQKMATDIIEWLFKRGFILNGAYNMSYDDSGIAVQADLMFNNTL